MIWVEPRSSQVFESFALNPINKTQHLLPLWLGASTSNLYCDELKIHAICSSIWSDQHTLSSNNDLLFYIMFYTL